MNNPRWLQITARISAMDSKLSTADRICELTRELLDFEHATIAMVVLGNYDPTAASDSVALALEEEQFALGDGPSFDARESAAPILVDDITGHTATGKWPIFAKLAAKHSIRAVIAFPLRIGGAYIGVLSAFGSRPKLLNAEQYADGLILAALAAAELVNKRAASLNAIDSMAGPAEIYEQSALQLAAGMVAESLNCSVLEGLVLIRARAFADDLPVALVAKDVLARKTVIEK